MSISISVVYPESSAVVPLPVQGANAAPTAVRKDSEIPGGDTVTLSQAARVDQLSVLGATPAQIADNLGISLSTVNIDLGIVATTDTVPVVAAHPAASGTSASGTAAATATAAPAAPASPTKAAAAAVPDSATTNPATTTPISPTPAVQTAAV
jgi:hypothetical protein